MKKTAIIAGATGMTGSQLLDHILEKNSYERVIVLTRRQTKYEDPRVKVLLVDYNKLHAYRSEIAGHHYYCCLGTTLKQAGTTHAYYRIDYLYAYKFSLLAEGDPNCTQLISISSVGANPNSPILYTRIKGRLEKDMERLDIKGLSIFRPSFILGNRPEPRFMEEVAKRLNCFVRHLFVLPRYNCFAIKAHQLAVAMLHAALAEKTGCHIYNPIRINTLSVNTSVPKTQKAMAA